jgi:heat shock protein HslJ
MRMALFTLSAITCLSVSACSRDTGQAAAPAAPPAEEADSAAADAEDPGVLVGDWRLVTIGGEPAPEGLDVPTLMVQADGRVAGFAGVNRYMGSLGGQEGKVFGPMPTTMMAGPPEAMALEARFNKAMSEATDFRVEGDRLTIVSGTDDLVFERAD